GILRPEILSSASIVVFDNEGVGDNYSITTTDFSFMHSGTGSLCMVYANFISPPPSGSVNVQFIEFPFNAQSGGSGSFDITWLADYSIQARVWAPPYQTKVNILTSAGTMLSGKHTLAFGVADDAYKLWIDGQVVASGVPTPS